LFHDALNINEETCCTTIKKIMTQSRELENTILKAENIVDKHSRECTLDIYQFYYSEQVNHVITFIMNDYDSKYPTTPWNKAEYQKNLLNYLEKELQIRIEDKVKDICHKHIDQIGKDLNELFQHNEQTVDVPLLQLDWSHRVVYRRTCTAIITTFTAISVAILSMSTGLFTLPVLAITGIGAMGAVSSEFFWTRKSLHHEIENDVMRQLNVFVTKGVESGEEIPAPIEKTQKKVKDLFEDIKVQITTTIKKEVSTGVNNLQK